jgi:N-acetylmuramoyl-L-alanine amidase
MDDRMTMRRRFPGPRPPIRRPSFASVTTPWSMCTLFLLAAACAPAAAPAPPAAPVPGAPGAALPPVPPADGPLRIDVVYPAENAQLTAADSNFIFGNLGTGNATLTINGAPVEVAANGAWLGFLPVPADGVYRLVATARGETAESTRRVRVPASAARLDGSRLGILEGSLSPSGIYTGEAGERIEVRVRGTPGARATLRLPDGRAIALTETAVVERQTAFMLDRAEARPDVAEYVGAFELREPILGEDTAAVPALMRRPGHVTALELRDRRPAVIELVRGSETVRAPLAATIGVLDARTSRVGVAATTRPDSTLIGTKLPAPGNPFQWFFPNGTRLEITGESGNYLRVRLTPELHVWVLADGVRLLPDGTPPPRGEVGTIEVTPADEYARISFSMTERVPYHVEPGERGAVVTFYGATGRTGFMGYGRTDPFVESVRWAQPMDGVYRVEIELDRPLWGVMHGWDAGGNLELRLRRPPVIDPAAPLRGLHIGVDAGHPPGGAIGPTRLTEADANLMVARRLVPMLERAGARVLEIRPDTATVGLADRPLMAIANDVHLLVSIHFNAFPDGVNPFERHGTIMFYYWPHSRDFARHLQREILDELGLPDRGVRFQDLALPRTPWMPSVLTETAFMMIPEIESALRDPAVQERIAAAHFRGIEAFVREAAAGR